MAKHVSHPDIMGMFLCSDTYILLSILEVLAGAAHHDWPSTIGGIMGDAFAFTDDDKQCKGQSTPTATARHLINSRPGKFFRSLYEVMLRSNRTDVHDLITSFINVQVRLVLTFYAPLPMASNCRQIQSCNMQRSLARTFTLRTGPDRLKLPLPSPEH
jgi:hypothetical protein